MPENKDLDFDSLFDNDFEVDEIHPVEAQVEDELDEEEYLEWMYG